MGSEEFPKLVFNKVFKEDIERLRSMEDMWKTRRPPEPLDSDTLSQEALGVGSAVASKDQVVWTVAENYAVFADSLRRLSNRMEETRANADVGNSSPILTFDKDDDDTLDFVAASANLRSHLFGIEMRSKFDIKRKFFRGTSKHWLTSSEMAGNIIPAIATTNAMTAGLIVLQAFKIMRNEMQKAKLVFLTRGTERVLSSEALRPPNPQCPVCSVAQTTVHVDTQRATLKDLVDGLLKLELGYGGEFSVNSDAGLLYDPDEDENLSRTFSDLGLKDDTFLTIVDEDDTTPKVNLVLSIAEQAIAKDEKPIRLTEKPQIALKPMPKPDQQETPPQTNGHTPAVPETNGVHKRKRDADDVEPETDDSIKKRGKVVLEPGQGDQAVLIEDNGAIVID